MDPNTAIEAAAEGAKAITKFQEIIQKVFNPKWTRAQTDADMDANERKLQLIRDNPDMDIVFIGDEMHARKSTPEELASRAAQRMYIEAVRQETNLEKVLEVTAKELPSAETVTEDPVNDDWISRFFDIVKNVSTDDMQYIWGKILAGEITQPGSFSMRTLDTIRNISQSEAMAFQRVVPLVMRSGSDFLISSKKEILNQHGVTYEDIMLLDECGLVVSSGTLSLNLTIPVGEKTHIRTETLVAIIESTSSKQEKVSIAVYSLTKAGRELYSILDRTTNEDYFLAVLREIFDKNKTKIRIMTHRIIATNGNTISYNPSPVRIYKEEQPTV